MTKFDKILVAIDFAEPSSHALEIGIELAKQFRSALVLVHTCELTPYAYSPLAFLPSDLLTPLVGAAQEMLDETLSTVQREVPSATAILRRGIPWREILATIEETHPDLVTMGTHGRSAAGRLLFGSVAEKIVRASPAPVMTVHARREPAL